MIKTVPFLSLILLLFITACGTSGNSLTSSTQDPKDAKLIEAVTAYVKKQGAPPNSVYDFARVDLNGDGRRDALVLFKLPHTHWCGWDGCGMMIFKANNNSFVPLSSVSGVRGPVYVRRTGTKGWRDIIIRISGTNIRDKNIALQFNGSVYPSSPMLAPTMHIPLRSMDVEKFFN